MRKTPCLPVASQDKPGRKGVKITSGVYMPSAEEKAVIMNFVSFPAWGEHRAQHLSFYVIFSS
jgi:hypothetical protein